MYMVIYFLNRYVTSFILVLNFGNTVVQNKTEDLHTKNNMYISRFRHVITVEVLFLPKRWLYTEVVDDSAQLSFGILFKHKFFESYKSWETIVSNHYKICTQEKKLFKKYFKG